MSVHEAVSTYKWISATLTASPSFASACPGGIWRGVAPKGTLTPFVVVSLLDGADTLTMNAIRVLTKNEMQVKVLGPASNSAAVESAAALVDDLLKRASGTATGAIIHCCSRESPIDYPEVLPDGSVWWHLGGRYKVEMQQA